MREHDGWQGGKEREDEGFMLLGALVLVFLLLLALTVAAPRIARELQREKEVESERRANQYVRAIRMYYKKFGHYPGSIEQLEKTNNQRFLRQRYVDPLTGKSDWRLIHVGENQTKVKGFFGQDLPGLQSGLGSAAGMASSTSSSIGGAGAASGAAFPNAGAGAGASAGSNAAGAGGGLGAGTSGTATGGGTGTGTNGVASQTTSDLAGTGGPIMGIGSAKTGEAMLVVNEQTSYETWEFLYDPRIEQLYAKASLLGGLSSGAATSTGLGPSTIPAAPGASGTPSFGGTPTVPPAAPVTPPL